MHWLHGAHTHTHMHMHAQPNVAAARACLRQAPPTHLRHQQRCAHLSRLVGRQAKQQRGGPGGWGTSGGAAMTRWGFGGIACGRGCLQGMAGEKGETEAGRRRSCEVGTAGMHKIRIWVRDHSPFFSRHYYLTGSLSQPTPHSLPLHSPVGDVLCHGVRR